MRKGALVLGIDVGTSGTKVIAVSESGEVVAAATAGYEMAVPAIGWAEQDPDDWWRATIEAVRKVVDALASRGVPREIAAISFSGQMHGLVPLDGEGRVIRPSIIWCDLRSAAEAAKLEQELGRDQIIAWTENPPLPNFTVTKLLWMKTHEPEAYARIATVLLPKDYVRLKMTGLPAMDVADASGTLLFDVARRVWSEDMCRATGTPRDWLPAVTESNEVVGHLTREAAAQLGLGEGIPIVAGAGDQAAGAVGLGVIDPGEVSAVFGTSGVVLAPTEKPLRDPRGCLHTFCHAVPGRWFVMGVTQAAGGSLQWYKRRFGQMEQAVADAAGEDVYSILMREAERVAPGSEGLVFLPYLMGERTPHLDPNARGAWIGLQWRHERAQMVRALLEGVSFSLRDCAEVMRELGVNAQSLKASGGGAQGRLWMEIFASVMRAPVEIVQGAHGPAYGAAVLAAQGVGLLGESAAEVRQWMTAGETLSPNPAWTSAYDALYPLYQQAYTALRHWFEQVSQLSRTT